MKIKRINILKAYMLIVGLFQIGFWGLSHIFFPQWYWVSIAGKDPQMLNTQSLLLINEIGVSTLGMGLATIIASVNPLKSIPVIIMLFIAGLGSIGVTLYHILVRHASWEWPHIIIVGVQMVLLAVLYPWTESIKEWSTKEKTIKIK